MGIRSTVTGIEFRTNHDIADIEQEIGDVIQAVAGVPREAIEADRARKPRRTAVEREQAAIAKAEEKVASLRAKERTRRLRVAHGHIEQAMVYMQHDHAVVRLPGGGGYEKHDILNVLVDIRAALREEIGE